MEVINLGKSHERDGHTEPVKQEFIEKERKAEPAIERELDSAESDEAKESSIKDTPKCALIINLVAEVKDETRSCEGESQSELTENKRKRCEEEERRIDLLRIKQNIHTGVTRTTIELQRDVMLMFFNSLWYNECSFYDHRMGPELLDCYLQNYQDWLNTQELVQSVGEAPHYRETMTSEGNTHKDVLSTPGSGSQDEGYKTSGGKRKRVSESKKGSNKKRQEEAKELLDEGEPVKQEFIEKEQKAELAIKRELDSAESDEVKETSIEDTPKCALIKNLVAEVKDERSCEGESKSELTKRKRKRREHEQWAIDLLRIEKNIKTGVTRTWTEIQRDLMLAFFNHMKYKCSLLVHRIASEMVEDCLQLIQIFMEMAERL